jgi:hypothetical protein
MLVEFSLCPFHQCAKLFSIAFLESVNRLLGNLRTDGAEIVLNILLYFVGGEGITLIQLAQYFLSIFACAEIYDYKEQIFRYI